MARFRVVPYFAREHIDIPEGILKIIDCDQETLDEIETQADPDEDMSRDYLMEGVIGLVSDVSEDET